MNTRNGITALALLLVAGAASADATTAHSHGAGAKHDAPAAAALPLADGEVRKVDAAAGKVTLRHGRLENLDMAPMTMVFRVKDPAWLQSLKVGDKVRFAAERVDGDITVVALQPAQ